MLEQYESTALEQATQQATLDGTAERIGDSCEASGNGSEVAAVAYRLWQQRGCPEGSPEEDWFLAEREVRRAAATGAAAENGSTP